jgi:UDP-glucose 4-epimerase
MIASVLVTGGAGYIGSHVVRQLGEAGYRVVVLDDLSTGFAEAVLHGDLVVGSTGDAALVARVLRQHRVDAVLHFAAHMVVPESVAEPLRYYANNTANSRTLLECCVAAGVRRFVFSSTAAVYGVARERFVCEDSPTAPINPYGASKLMTEWMLRDVAATGALRYVALRYFNVAGADLQTRIGQSTRQATHLIKVAAEAAMGKRDSVAIYGTDFPTPDGTGVRDYIHVEDLARAHLLALEYLDGPDESQVLNCGYGHGFSVREVLSMVERVSGRRLRIREQNRRPGDPPSLIAGADRIRSVLEWSPRHDDLETIVSTALAWERKLAERAEAS